MTRRNGFFIQAAPCCGTLYRTDRFSSVSMFGLYHWSDGSGDAPVQFEKGGFCKCGVCGRYFSLRDCEKVATFGTDELEQSAYADVRALPELNDDELQACLRHPFSRTSPTTEIFLRCRHWRALNRPFRKHYSECMEQGQAERICFNPTIEQKENMRALLCLLEQEDKTAWLERAELHHELGEKDQALACLSSPEIENTYLRDLMKSHIEQGLQGPLRYDLPQRAPNVQGMEPVSQRPVKSPWWRRLFSVFQSESKEF